MSQERNFGVTEAGLGLTVITCLLVALGYWIVQRLGGPGETPPVEVRASSPISDPLPGAEPVVKRQQPQVLLPEDPGPADVGAPYTANRPQWLSYQEDSESGPPPSVEGVLTPLAPDAGQSLWPPVEADSQHEPSWPEPLQVN